MKKYFTPKQLADELGVSRISIIRWIRMEKLRAIVLNPEGSRKRYLIPVEYLVDIGIYI